MSEPHNGPAIEDEKQATLEALYAKIASAMGVKGMNVEKLKIITVMI